MLITTLKNGGCFRVGDDIIITVFIDSDTRVKLAIDAPKHVKVRREELLQALAESATATPSTA